MAISGCSTYVQVPPAPVYEPIGQVTVPVESVPIEPAPVPVESVPIEPAPVPVESVPIEPAPVTPAPTDHAAMGHGMLAPPINGTPSGWMPEAFFNASIAGTARFADINQAYAEGYYFGEGAQVKFADGRTLLHMRGPIEFREDGQILNPNAPETLMYRIDDAGTYILVGAMYRVNENEGSPLVGDVGYFHRHDSSQGGMVASEPGESGMMHVWFTEPNDMAAAYGAHAPGYLR